MSKNIANDRFFVKSGLTERSMNEDDQREDDIDSDALQKFNRRRHSVTKGKQMLDIKRRTQEINFKLQTLENRVKFIENEQVKAEKSVKTAKEKFRKYSQIRQAAESDKQLNASFKEKRIKEMTENKEKNLFFKNNQKQKIAQERERILRQNFLIKSEVKAGIILAESALQQKKLKDQYDLQKRAKELANQNKQLKEKRKSRNSSLKAMKEDSYIQKMQLELQSQEKALNKIKELEKLEGVLLEQRKTTDMLDSLDTDLLRISPSPLSSTLKPAFS